MTTPTGTPAPAPAAKRAQQWSDDRNEDWAKRTWDVRTSSGDPVDTLDGLAIVLGKSREAAAADLLKWPSGAAAPAALRKEAEDVVAGRAPGGQPKPHGTFDVEGLPGIADRSHLAADAPVAKPKPEEQVKRGDAVTWNGGTGRVDLIVKRGIVPGAPNVVHGRENAPAVRVVLADGEKAAVLASDVTVIDPRPQVDVQGKGTNGLVTLVAAFQGAEGEHTPPWARVTGTAVKAAYARGKASYPGAAMTLLDADDWALGRVKAFLTLLTTPERAPSNYTRDHDLLPKSHPARQSRGL